MPEVDYSRVRPYGDTMDDGMVQLSFTLPVSAGERAAEAARQMALKMGLYHPKVVHMADLSGGFSFFILYGSCQHFIDYNEVQAPGLDVKILARDEINGLIAEKLGRRIVVVGACIESDAHTVGIDAILNLKGYNGHKGLESYRGLAVHNLGAQVTCEELAGRALELGADVILVSQVVTQKDVHIQNLSRLVDVLTERGLRNKVILIAGGPGIDLRLARQLGYDAGFGRGTHPGEVASFIVDEMLKRKAFQGGNGCV